MIDNLCPKCGGEGVPVVYGYVQGDPEFDPRVYTAGSVPDSYFNEKMELPIRHCYDCNIDFCYRNQEVAMCISYEDAVNVWD